MKKFIWRDLSPAQRISALARPAALSAQDKENSVRAILDNVRRNGDNALHTLTMKFDGYDPGPLFIDPAAIRQAREKISKDLRLSIECAYKNIRKFHSHQGFWSYTTKTFGAKCSRTVKPVQNVGLYVPGGSAPLLSTVLMLGIPSQLAGNPQRILCTPGKDTHPAILYAASLCGIDKIARIGGAQAIAAMAYGTQTIPRADRIFGPGNIYVTLAKTLAAQEPGGPAIDMPAGPSEVLLIATRDTPPAFAAADLLAQAEHDPDSQVILVATDSSVLESIIKETQAQLSSLPRRDIAAQAISNSTAILADDIEEALAISNLYAPEHLILCFESADRYRDLIINAGSVFSGIWTPESLGDYASGTNHVLPTAGAARGYSGIGVESFQKTITWQGSSQSGLSRLGPHVTALARAETLEAHARAIDVRLKGLSS